MDKKKIRIYATGFGYLPSVFNVTEKRLSYLCQCDTLMLESWKEKYFLQIPFVTRISDKETLLLHEDSINLTERFILLMFLYNDEGKIISSLSNFLLEVTYFKSTFNSTNT